MIGESISPALLAAQTCHVDCRQRVFFRQGGVSTTLPERLKAALGDDVKHIRVSIRNRGNSSTGPARMRDDLA